MLNNVFNLYADEFFTFSKTFVFFSSLLIMQKVEML